METQTEENVFGPAPEEPESLVEQIHQAVRDYWNTHMQPVGYIWIDREAWLNESSEAWTANSYTWEMYGCRAVLLDDFFEDKEFKFKLKP